MKKLLTVIFAAFMVFAAADSALAFSTDSLMLVVYNANDNQVVVDLGSLSSLDLTLQNYTLANTETGTFSLSDFGDGITYSDLNVAVFGSTGNATADPQYVGITDDVEVSWAKSSLSSFSNSCQNIAIYSGDGSISTGVSSSSVLSYNYIMNSNGTSVGYFSAFLNSYEYGETTLVEDGYVDLYLQETYYTGGRAGSVLSDTTATVRVYSDGTVTLNPSTVPVPGTMMLLSMGLLGLVGIRRK